MCVSTLRLFCYKADIFVVRVPVNEIPPCLSSTADALTAVLTKINRLDIVTLLEGPIFDYGNISGTRCFADDNAVFPDQSDGKV